MSKKDIIKHQWEKGQSGNPKGRPKGSKNRSTVARKWLEVLERIKNPITGDEEQLSQEDISTLAQIKKARKGDTAAYKALLDSAWGSPKTTADVSFQERSLFKQIDLDVPEDNSTEEDLESSQ